MAKEQQGTFGYQETAGCVGCGGPLGGHSEGSGFIVGRDRLVAQVMDFCKQPAIVFVRAPQGFGKTALLLQCASAVRNSPERGIAVLIGAAALDVDELMEKVERCADELSSDTTPFILIDDLPAIEASRTSMFAEFLRGLRSQGYSVIASCTSVNKPFVKAMGDSHKIGASALAVHPREYARWAKTFSIASTLDVYELTQGIPALVASLRSLSKGSDGMLCLDNQVEELYRAVLEEAAAAQGKLHRIMMLLLLLGEGSFGDLERCGVRVGSEMLAELRREYPIFALDVGERTFSCLGAERSALVNLWGEIADRHPECVKKAVRIQVRARHVGQAVELMRIGLSREESLEVVAQFPLTFALAGHAQTVRSLFAGMEAAKVVTGDVGAVLALYAASLVAGDYRIARMTSKELCRRAEEIERDVAPAEWACALALHEAQSTIAGVDLPALSDAYARGADDTRSKALLLHACVKSELLGGAGTVTLDGEYARVKGMTGEGGQLEVPLVLLYLDALLDEALHGSGTGADARDDVLNGLMRRLDERRLAPLLAYARMVAAVRRMLSGHFVSDERAFTDAGTVAIRESDLATQLFCLVCEGWQALSLGQLVNAQFRGQQVRKLASRDQTFLRDWALLLERSATLMNTPRVTIREEAEAIDLAATVKSSAEAWATALHLSTARFDSDLSVWFSLHKALMLEEGFRPLARFAMAQLGERADSLRRLIPSPLARAYGLDDAVLEREDILLEAARTDVSDAVGQVNIRLFGGFQVDRNGHLLTDALWHRKKAGILAARLTLEPGVFVSRRVLVEEMWPESEYPRARQNLYTATSTLKAAFRQEADGPQYLLAQGDGIALNREFVSSDTARFDALAREILLKRIGVSSRSIIESCLKLEQLYSGPLFVPSVGSPAFFIRMRRIYETRFIDCMVRGIDAAMEDEDISAASWLSDAALRHVPTREDVLRRTMKVLNTCGRKKEVVDLYVAHIRYLRNELCAEPEPETRRVYEEIVGKAAARLV